jgi:S1-C subfamily serine protease
MRLISLQRVFSSWPAVRLLGLLVGTLFMAACQQTGGDYRPTPLPPARLAQHLTDRFALMISTSAKTAETAVARGRVGVEPGVKVATATPVSADGFFLTASHGLGGPGQVCVVFYSTGARARRGIAQVCWVDEKADLALLKAPFDTPAFYRWTPAGQVLKRGTQVRHGGAATGPDSDSGSLLQPVSGSRWNRDLRHSLRLEPGDSGGPLITLSGELVGINQAVGYIGVMDTRFFSESRAVRPSLRFLENAIRSALAQPGHRPEP